MTAQIEPDAPAAPACRLADQPVPLVPAATIAVLAGAALVAGCRASQIAAVAAVGLVQLALVLGWVLSTGLPGRIGAIAIGLAAAAGADYTATRWYEHGYEASLAVLGVAVAAMFAHQLARGVVRSRVVESLSGVAFIVIGVCALTGLLVLRRHDGGPTEAAGIAAAAGAALSACQLVDAILARPRIDPEVNRGLSGMVAGVAAGCGAGCAVMRSSAELTPARAAAVAAGVALMACLLSVGASFAAAGSAAVAGSAPAARPDGQRTDPESPGASAVAGGSAWLRPVAAVAAVLCLATPTGYVLVTGLSV